MNDNKTEDLSESLKYQELIVIESQLPRIIDETEQTGVTYLKLAVLGLLLLLLYPDNNVVELKLIGLKFQSHYASYVVIILSLFYLQAAYTMTIKKAILGIRYKKLYLEKYKEEHIGVFQAFNLNKLYDSIFNETINIKFMNLIKNIISFSILIFLWINPILLTYQMKYSFVNIILLTYMWMLFIYIIVNSLFAYNKYQNKDDFVDFYHKTK